MTCILNCLLVVYNDCICMQATAACWGCVSVLDRDGEVVQRVGVLPPWLPHLIRVTQLPASIGIAW
jgi:hypothetical protein